VITYEVTAIVPGALVSDYEGYMRERHIPDLLATGCFSGACFSRSAPGRYRVRYEAFDRESLDRYLAVHAAEMRGHFMETFPEGVSVEREEWEVLELW
jgi:hypothetical protein